MEWDKFKMAQKFLQKANSIHPEEVRGVDRDASLALQDFYYDCYMSSFSREELLKRLGQVLSGNFQLPDEMEVNESAYRAAYIKEAKIILESVQQGEDPTAHRRGWESS